MTYYTSCAAFNPVSLTLFCTQRSCTAQCTSLVKESKIKLKQLWLFLGGCGMTSVNIFYALEKTLNCIKIITVSCAMGQMVWTRYPWWPLHDPDTLNTWFPNTECFKGPRILPSCWSRRLCQDPYAGVSTPSPSFSLPSTANSSNTVPRFPPQPPLSPLTHMCIVIRRGSGGGWGLGVGKEGGFNHLV